MQPILANIAHVVKCKHVTQSVLTSIPLPWGGGIHWNYIVVTSTGFSYLLLGIKVITFSVADQGHSPAFRKPPHFRNFLKNSVFQ